MSLMDSIADVSHGTGAVAGRIRFVERPLTTDTVVAEFLEPTTGFAVCDPLDVEALVSAIPAENHNGFRFALVAGGAATPYEIRKRIEDWAAASTGSTAVCPAR